MATASGTRCSPGLAKLLRALQGYRGRIPREELTRLVRSADLGPADLAPWIRFGPDHYLDALLCRHDHVEVRCLCWRSGQHSSIHDHRGSLCVVRVLQGTLTNTDFVCDASGTVRAVASYDLACGAVDVREDDEIHQLGNFQADGAEAVSLHVYAPPLGATTLFPHCPKVGAAWNSAGSSHGTPHASRV